MEEEMAGRAPAHEAVSQGFLVFCPLGCHKAKKGQRPGYNFVPETRKRVPRLLYNKHVGGVHTKTWIPFAILSSLGSTSPPL